MPCPLVLTKASGSEIERSTWVSAAKLTIASHAVADRAVDGVAVLDRADDELDVGQVLQVLAPPGVRELVEHDDLVALVAHPQAHEVRADEAGPSTDEQPHTAFLSARCPATPCCHGGRTIGSGRSVPSTLKAGRGAGR